MKGVPRLTAGSGGLLGEEDLDAMIRSGTGHQQADRPGNRRNEDAAQIAVEPQNLALPDVRPVLKNRDVQRVQIER